MGIMNWFSAILMFEVWGVRKRPRRRLWVLEEGVAGLNDIDGLWDVIVRL